MSLGTDVAVLRRYGFVLALGSALFMAGRCSAQEEDNQSAVPNSSSQQNAPEPSAQQRQKPDPSANDQGGSPTPGEAAVAKMQEGVNRVMNLPAEWFLGAYVPANRNLQPLNNPERREVYVRQTYLTGASYLKRLFAAGVDQVHRRALGSQCVTDGDGHLLRVTVRRPVEHQDARVHVASVERCKIDAT